MTVGPEPPVVPGHTVGAYLGHGSTGTLWEAWNAAGQRVALKVADRAMRIAPESMRRFSRREAAALASVRHPNLVRGLGAGTTTAGQIYIALEYLEGETLGDRIRRLGPRPESEAVQVGLALAGPLEQLHGHGLVHRDVKPDNVMWLPDDSVKLLDLGLVDESDLASPGCGSPGYASPEMMTRRHVGPASDLWALGVTMATMVLGRLPFAGSSSEEVLHNAFHERVTLPEAVGGRPLSEDFRRLMGRLLEKAPSGRYRSAGELALDLQALRDGDRPLGALWATRTQSARTRGRLLFACGACVVGVVAVLVSRAVPAPSGRVSAPDAGPAGAGVEVGLDADVEAALARAEDPGADIGAVRSELLRLSERGLDAVQRARYEKALDSSVMSADRRGEDELRRRARLASRRLAAGDLAAVRALLEAWPQEQAGSAAALEAKRLSTLWCAEARRPLEALLAEVDRIANGDPPPSAGVVAQMRVRLDAARGDPAAPIELGGALAGAEARLLAMQERLASREREALAWEGVLRAWGTEPAGREVRLRALAAREAGGATRAASALAALLAKAQEAEELLAGQIERAGSRSTALWLGQGFTVGPLAAGVGVDDVFLPGCSVWRAEAPGAPVLDDLHAALGDGPRLDAWLALRGLPVRGNAFEESPVLRELGRRVAAVAPSPSDATAIHDPTWRELRALWPLASRAWRAAVGVAPASASPLERAWRDMLARGQARPGAVAEQVPQVPEARERLLADDPAGCWAALEPVAHTHPGSGELALLRSMALTGLVDVLPTLGTRLFAFVEARRALDLDPGLGGALRQLSVTGMALHRWAPADLRVVLAPLVCACNESLLALRQESGPTLAFLAHHYADTDRIELALATARKAVAGWPEDPEALLALARLEARQGALERSRQLREKAQRRLRGELPEWTHAWFR